MARLPTQAVQLSPLQLYDRSGPTMTLSPSKLLATGRGFEALLSACREPAISTNTSDSVPAIYPLHLQKEAATD